MVILEQLPGELLIKKVTLLLGRWQLLYQVFRNLLAVKLNYNRSMNREISCQIGAFLHQKGLNMDDKSITKTKDMILEKRKI